MFGTAMKPMLVSWLKTVLIFIAVTLVFLLPGNILSRAIENNKMNFMNVAVLVIIYTLIYWGALFVSGRIFLEPYILTVKIALLTVLPLLILVIAIPYLMAPTYLSMWPLADLINIHPIIMIVYYIIFNSLSWLSIVFGMLSKAVKGQ
jgi:hypothetical protein